MDDNEFHCRRCGKLITGQGYRIDKPVPPSRGGQYYLDGDVSVMITFYHSACLPPNLFHQIAGSLPVGQSPAGSSLSNEHALGGGLSRRRKRPARRVRYKRTAARHTAEDNARERRQSARTEAMTITETLERGGTPKLCCCLPSSIVSYSFLTSHGYCRYCGGWNHRVFRDACGDDAVATAISELELYKRLKMQELVSATSEAE